jgi:hypothetical protein
MIIRGGIQRLFGGISAGVLAFINNARGGVPFGGYVSGQFYLPSYTSQTNTNTAGFVAADTLYAYPCLIGAPVTIASLQLRTSATSAGNLSTVKVGIYDSNPTTLQPRTLLGARNTAVATTSSNTNVNCPLAANVTLQPGLYWLVSKHTFTVTAPLFAINNSSLSNNYNLGATSAANIWSSLPINGYTGTDAFANDMPATFPAATALSSSGVLPVVAFGVA